jgi:hypothetical protein
MIDFKSNHDEVTIPTMHFIEMSAGSDIRIG